MLPFNLGIGGGGVDIGDNIAYSLMLDSTASQYLSRTNTTSTTITFFCAFKRGKLGVITPLLDSSIKFNANDTLTAFGLTTTAVFRDTAAPYHIHVSNGGLVVNGVSYGAVTTAALTNPRIGFDGTNYADGLFSMVYLVDGTSDTYSNYGRYSADVPNFWVFRRASPTFGAKGSLLDFSNGAALGTDTSGSGNNWTLNGGITSANQYTDTPTNNYATLNPLINTPGTLTKGNLTFASSTQYHFTPATIAATTGKWSAEFYPNDTAAMFGVYETSLAQPCGSNLGSGYAWYGTVLLTGASTTAQSGLAAFAAGDTVRVEMDLDNSVARWYKKSGGVETLTITQALSAGKQYTFGVGDNNSVFAATFSCNFGQKAFLTTPTAGFKALCTANLPETSILNSSAAVAHRYATGSGIAASIASDRAAWADWIEIFKRTDAVEDWKFRFSSDTGNMWACNTNAAKTAWVAPSTGNYLGLALRVGAAYGVVTGTYAGNNGASQDVAHALGVPPKAAIIKDESTGSVYFWHTSMTGAAYFTIINSVTPPAQSNTNTPFGGSGWLSSTFGVTSNATNNLNATGHTYRYILFADVSGLLKSLGVTGNASTDGTFEYVEHKPQIQIEKDLAATTGFYLFSDLIDTYNVTSSYLLMNTTAGIATGTGVDITSSGIKHRSATIANAADAYGAISIGRSPFKYSNAR